MLAALFKLPRQWFAAWLARRLPPVQSIRLQQQHIFIVPTGNWDCLCRRFVVDAVSGHQLPKQFGLCADVFVGVLGFVDHVSYLAQPCRFNALALQARSPCFVGEYGNYRCALTQR